MECELLKKPPGVISSPLVSAVIVTYKSLDYILKCIRSFEEAACDIQHEIIVVDNASEEGLTDIVRSEFPHVLCIDNETNEGFARAVNRGAWCARGEYIIILNPDTLFQRDALKTLIMFIEGQARQCVVGPRTVDEAGNVTFSCRSLPHFGNILKYVVAIFRRGKALKNPRKYLLDIWKPNRTVDLAEYDGYLQGSCLLMRLEFFRSIGMFDERYFLYAEDADLGFRVNKAGFSSFLVDESEVVHVGRHIASKEPKTTKYFIETYIQYIDKNLGFVHGLALKTALFFLVINWLVMALLRGDTDKKRAIKEALRSFLFL